MKTQLQIAATLVLHFLLFGNAFAHTELVASIPSADSTVQGVDSITLEFGDTVKLARVQLLADGETFTLPLDRSSPMAKVTRIPVEQSLDVGSYTVKWSAVGEDGHLMRGEFAFTLTSPSANQAQDIFGDVSIEPRPSEYLLWDAETVAEIKGKLQQGIREGDGIWGTDFIFDRVLQEADHRPHSISIVHRSGYTQPEIHELKWDIYVILDGSGTARIGGERVNWISGLPPAEQRPRLEGYQEFQVAKGDILHVPARVWHQMLTDPDTSITYALINIVEPAP